MLKQIPRGRFFIVKVSNAPGDARDERCEMCALADDHRQSLVQSHLSTIEFGVLREEVAPVTRAQSAESSAQRRNGLLAGWNRCRETRVEMAEVRQLAAQLAPSFLGR